MAPAIVHRDLHIANVLIKKGRAKLADFGCSRVAVTARGQSRYPGLMAVAPPEARRHAPATPLTPSYDMYGFGFLMAQTINRLLHHDEWEELQPDDDWKDDFVQTACLYLTGPQFPDEDAGRQWVQRIRGCVQVDTPREAAVDVLTWLMAIQAALEE
jgi:serine/threonine protein kinase